MSRRVAFVINQLGGIGSGGSDRVVCVLANEFAARGWDVDILALTDDDSIERKLAPEISVRFEPHVRHARGYVKVGTRMLLGAHLVRSYVRQHPDAIVVSFIAWVSMCTIVGTRGLRRGPVVLAERTDPASDPASPIARQVRDLCYRFADALVFQTPDAAAYFTRLRTLIARVIPNPVTSGLPSWSGAGNRAEVVTAVRLEAQKNLPMLIDAFAPIGRANPDARLRIFGEGKARQAIQDHIDELDIRDSVALEGHASDVHEQMSKASMFVLSSDFEGMPNSLLEAMSMGMPVISVDCPIGGPRMLIEDQVNGMLIGVGDVDAMTERIQRIIDHPELARNIGHEAANARNLYAVTSITDMWEQLFIELANAE